MDTGLDLCHLVKVSFYFPSPSLFLFFLLSLFLSPFLFSLSFILLLCLKPQSFFVFISLCGLLENWYLSFIVGACTRTCICTCIYMYTFIHIHIHVCMCVVWRIKLLDQTWFREWGTDANTYLLKTWMCPNHNKSFCIPITFYI